MNAATLPPPAPGQTYQDYLSSVVCAAAERWGRWKAERGEALPEPPPPAAQPRLPGVSASGRTGGAS